MMQFNGYSKLPQFTANQRVQCAATDRQDQACEFNKRMGEYSLAFANPSVVQAVLLCAALPAPSKLSTLPSSAFSTPCQAGAHTNHLIVFGSSNIAVSAKKQCWSASPNVSMHTDACAQTRQSNHATPNIAKVMSPPRWLLLQYSVLLKDKQLGTSTGMHTTAAACLHDVLHRDRYKLQQRARLSLCMRAVVNV